MALSRATALAHGMGLAQGMCPFLAQEAPGDLGAQGALGALRLQAQEQVSGRSCLCGDAVCCRRVRCEGHRTLCCDEAMAVKGQKESC